MKSSQETRLSSYFRVIGPIVALAFSILALYFVAVQRQETRRFDTDLDSISEEEALFILSRAEDAVDSANLVLTFIEGASVLAGIILVGAGIFGITSIQDLRRDTEAMKQEVLDRLQTAERELNERVDRAQHEFNQRAKHLTSLEAELEQSIENNRARIDEQIQHAQKEARSSFEALSYIIMAQRLAREHNLDAAILACREAHNLDPDNISNNYLLGILLIRKGELDEAILHLTESYNAALEDSEEVSTPSQAALGLAIRRKGDLASDVFERNRLYNQAENYLLEATQHDPQLLTEDRESYFGVLGSLYRRQGRIQDAIMSYERAVEVTPRRSYPFLNLAMLHLQVGNDDKVNTFRKAAEQKAYRMLEDHPDDYWARHDIALAAMIKGEQKESLAKFEEAIDLSPSVSVLESVLARLYFLQQIAAETPGLEAAIDVFNHAKQKFVPPQHEGA